MEERKDISQFEALREPFSPYYYFHIALQGWRIFDWMDREVDKWELWERVKRNPSLLEETKKRNHPDYKFVNKPGWSNGHYIAKL